MIQVYAGPESLAHGAAARVREIARDTLAAHETFSIALSGGTTPRAMFEVLAGLSGIDDDIWERTLIYWSDERCVPPTHEMSNFKAARDTLLDRLPISPGQVHRIRGELDDAEEAAEDYARELPATFDLILLGMGADGHTASIFPASPALGSRCRCISVVAPTDPPRRITLTPPEIRAAAEVLVLVSGADKAEAFLKVMSEEGNESETPARIARDRTWFVDASVANLARQKGFLRA